MSRRRPKSQAGVALLMVISAIVILALVLVEFGVNARTHLTQGVNLRDDARATTMADTALVMGRACLDPRAWGAMAAFQDKVDLERLCNLLLGIFIRGRVDLPLGGLSVELEGIEGVGIGSGDIEEIELKPEDRFIGMRGLWCTNRLQVDCGTRKAVVAKLRSLLCDPRVAHIFEREQEDGHKYTREEVIGNLVDWVDADDDRIEVVFAPQTAFEQGLGEGEDSYLRSRDRRYRAKDAPFDSVEELRLVPGINDELFEFLRDKISVYADERVDVNAASPDVIAALMLAHSPLAQAVETAVCGEEVEGGLDEGMRKAFLLYANIIVEYRNIRQSMPESMLAKPFKNPNSFIAVAKDPFTKLDGLLGGLMTTSAGGPAEALLARFGLPQLTYTTIAGQGGQGAIVNWSGMQQSIKTQTDLYRLVVQGRVGKMTRRLFAILRKDKLSAQELERAGRALQDEAKDQIEDVQKAEKEAGGALQVAGQQARAGGAAASVVIRTLYYREE